MCLQSKSADVPKTPTASHTSTEDRGVAIETEASQEFHGSLVVRILGLHCCSLGSIPGQGTKIIQAMWYSQTNTEASQQSPS